ncbi:MULTISPECIES: peptidoglycan D,D-transpeptidase FtsI family protein [Parachlamydia]|jgi:cell division protein FtsI (penicillin-binding protein 3)|uniref:Penicillin-binding protein transpeptidase domain-containing protein n=2 Tax=Parachlamydia acanthamoebae TaxID=83552 RepID=F8L101_PARAV|nr:penicillin-binding protein 2 [Parachlamydia acanthamoebae]CCB86920.1 putative uncharacterized protein [Parachlamydia acanthamoebae UV-7]
MKNQTTQKISLTDRKRLIILALFIFSLFALLIVQFYNIQIIQGEKWTQEAKKQHFFTIDEPFLRGSFISNTSIARGHAEPAQKFVVDIQKFHLHIDPLSIPEAHRDPIAHYLLENLTLPSSERNALRSQFDIKSRNRKLAMWLNAEDQDLLSKWWLSYAKQHKIARNALFFISDYQRSYPFGKLLGQVLHTIQNQKDDATKQALPTGGLELKFNAFLQGKQGKRLLMRSPRHSFETGEVITPPENGADVYLTINHCLQAIAEEELSKGVKKCKGKAGWAVIMEPRTGEILALAQYPFFYPPDYQKYFNDPNLTEHTKIKALTDANEPGSVMKPFTLATALMANDRMRDMRLAPIFDPEEMIPTANGRFPGRSKDLKDLSFHNYLNMYMALQKSTNIYMARIVERVINRLGNEWYRNVLSETFKFGQKTNLELPSESPGLLPRIGKKHPNGALEWSTPTPFSLAIGHNIQLNSIQIARAYAMLANGGYLVEPTLIRKIVKKNPDGTETLVLDHTTPSRTQKFPKMLSKPIVDEVVKAMKYVTKPGGSGQKGDIWGYTEVGKTSTAEKVVNGVYSKTQNVATFVGFTPIDNPAFVLLVTIEEPECCYIPGIGKNSRGGVATAPVFREIAMKSLEYLGIKPDDPYGYPVGDPRRDSEKAHWMQETRKLQEMYEKWNNKA